MDGFFPRDDVSRIARYLSRLNGAPAVAVFDVGTRGVRLVLAPLTPPPEWRADTFCVIGKLCNLGLAVEADDTLPLNASAFLEAKKFLRTTSRELKKRGVTRISIIATAWFRWLKNAKQVRAAIENETSVALDSVSQEREAELSLMTLPVVLERWRGPRQTPAIGDDECVVMLDQGGGSLEISWMRWGDRGLVKPPMESARFEELGTLALRKQFMSEGGGDWRPRMQEHIRSELVRDLPPHAVRSPHVFAVGSAIGGLLRGSNYEKHGRTITLERLEAQLARHHGAPSVGDPRLTQLFGLPVYQEALRRIGAPKLTYSGYGLAFGYYLSPRDT